MLLLIKIESFKLEDYFMKNIKDRKDRLFSFTLAEMMVVILIMTIILAAMAPVFTRKMRSGAEGGASNTSPWSWRDASANDLAFLINPENSRAVIGNNNAADTDNARLIINTNNTLAEHIIFKNANNRVGSLTIGNDKTISLKATNGGAGHSVVIGGFADGEETKADGSLSVAIGSGASAITNSVAIGSASIASSQAVAISANANAAANRSVAIGRFARAEGTGAVAIGTGTSSDNGTMAAGQNAIAIGSGARVLAPNAIVIGNETYRTGFGASGTPYAVGHDEYRVSIENGGLYVDGPLKVTGPTEYTGNIILNGDLQIGEGHYIKDKDGNILKTNYSAGGWSNFESDSRLKYVGSESKVGLDAIKQLKPFNYTFKKDEKKTPHVGVIAQDLQKVFPNAVKTDKDGFLTIRMEDMFYAVVNAIKELDNKIAEILNQVKDNRDKIQKLQTANEQLKKENTELKARLDRIEAKLK